MEPSPFTMVHKRSVDRGACEQLTQFTDLGLVVLEGHEDEKKGHPNFSHTNQWTAQRTLPRSFRGQRLLSIWIYMACGPSTCPCLVWFPEQTDSSHVLVCPMPTV